MAINNATRKQMESNSELLQVLSHLANGSKHFHATRHVAVKAATVEHGGFDPNGFDSSAFDVGELRIELDGNAAIKFGPSIGVLELADMALRFWEGYA